MLRSITEKDWPVILTIQQECYPDLPAESLSVLQSKWHVAPDCCFMLMLEKQEVGYCLAHPWRQSQPPTLAQVITPTFAADTLYLHDIAISSNGRGQGLALQVLTQLKQLALIKGLTHLSLVAIPSAVSFWRQQGFMPITINKALNCYGIGARYMTLPLKADTNLFSNDDQ